MMQTLNQIVVADALEYLQALPAGGVQLFLFSPPYNLGNTTGGGMRSAASGKGSKWTGKPKLAGGYDDDADNIPWPEYIAWQHAILTECWRCLPENGAIYYNHKPRIQGGVLIEPRDFVPRELPLRQRIIWYRAGGFNFNVSFYLPMYEEILVIAKPAFRLKSQGASGAGDVWSIQAEQGSWHPAPFPLKLAETVLETTTPALVCDPFAGSGTTGRAAKRLGIDFIGCDRNAAYVERANAEIGKERRLTMRQRSITEEIAETSDMFSEAA